VSVENKYEVTALVASGLTEPEAKELAAWVDAGKPGLSKHRAESFGSVYALGYSCQDLHKWFPEIPLAILLYARVYYGWDKIRAEYRAAVQNQLLESALTTKLESVRFVTELLNATHVRYRQQIMDFLANPKGAKPPEIMPDSLHQYGQLTALMRELLESISPGEKKKPGDEKEAAPLVSVTVGAGGEVKVVSDQKSAKSRLIDAISARKNKG
jgi:hypothetical protein